MINITRKKISITTKDIILMGVALAVIEVAKVALGFIAGIEIVTLLFVLYTLFFEKKMIYFLPTFLLIEGIVNGFGIWWIMYIYVWSILVLITYLFRKHQSLWFWSIFTGIYGLFFGLLCENERWWHCGRGKRCVVSSSAGYRSREIPKAAS